MTRTRSPRGSDAKRRRALDRLEGVVADLIALPEVWFLRRDRWPRPVAWTPGDLPIIV